MKLIKVYSRKLNGAMNLCLADGVANPSPMRANVLMMSSSWSNSGDYRWTNSTAPSWSNTGTNHWTNSTGPSWSNGGNTKWTNSTGSSWSNGGNTKWANSSLSWNNSGSGSGK